MDKLLKVAVILTAVDKMSDEIGRAVGKSEEKMKELSDKMHANFGRGSTMMGIGAGMVASLAPAVEAYAELENSSARLKSVLMKDGGTVSRFYGEINNLAVELGNKLPGTTQELQNMMVALIRNGVEEQDILNGVAVAAANLAVALEMPYDQAAEFAAKLRISANVASQDMQAFMDVIQRTRNLGVDTQEMAYAFGRTGLKKFGIEGIEAAKAMSALYAEILPITKSGETTGSGLSKILGAVMDNDKMSKANAALKQYGIQMEFVDQKTGKFKGVENLVAQLGQLSKFTDAQRLNIITAMFGDGEDSKIAAIIAANGVKGYNETIRKMSQQGTLDAKVDQQLRTLRAKWEATTGTITNALAAMGAPLGEALKPIVDMIGSIAAKLQEWATQYPGIFKFVGIFVAVTGSVMALRGAFLMAQAALAGIKLLMGGGALFNPWMIAIGIIAALAYTVYDNWDAIVKWFKNVWTAIGDWFSGLWESIKGIFSSAWKWIKNLFFNYTPHGLIYTHWDKITAWFSQLWEKVKAVFVATWEFVKGLFLKYHPIGIIYTHWDDITAYFSKLWDRVKGIFQGILDWIMGFGKKFWAAGANIVDSIIDGIKAKANQAVEAVKNLAKDIRDFFPFSPAKRGPLMDIHKIKLVETIADSVKPGALVKKMHTTAQLAANALITPNVRSGAPALAMAGRGGGGGAVQVHFSPQISLSGGATKADGNALTDALKKMLPELTRSIQREIEKQQRFKY